ncbi:MAG: hypothetical protein K9H26_06495 [Prolixibacteraceae bacterium]|nr:hypothetical protein [Prolixibacteraceae bacterium]
MEGFEMEKRLKNILTFLIFGSILSNTYSQESQYNFDNWPGKNSIAKTGIELPKDFVTKHNMNITKGSSSDAFIFRFYYNVNNIAKNGKLQVAVLSNSDEAQIALLNYLESLSTRIKPPMLNNEEFEYGDVAFGQVYDGEFRVAYTKNNVFIVIHAPLKDAKKIAYDIEYNIKKAPVWKNKDNKPSFIF